MESLSSLFNTIKSMSVHRWISLGFPLYLVIFEILVRNISDVNISGFLGPTLAASGLGFMIEVLKPKKVDIPDQLKETISKLPDNIVYRHEKDEKLVFWSFAFILISVLIWVYSCSISIQENSVDQFSNNIDLVSSMGFILGCINYLIGITFLMLKGE